MTKKEELAIELLNKRDLQSLLRKAIKRIEGFERREMIKKRNERNGEMTDKIEVSKKSIRILWEEIDRLQEDAAYQALTLINKGDDYMLSPEARTTVEEIRKKSAEVECMKNVLRRLSLHRPSVSLDF